MTHQAESPQPRQTEERTLREEHIRFDAAWVARSSLVVLLILTIAIAFWTLRQVVFLAFAGLLLAIVFRHGANAISARTPLGPKTALAFVIVGLAALISMIFMSTGPRITSEFATLSNTLPDALHDIETRLRDTDWGAFLLRQIESRSDPGNWSILGFITGTFSTLFGVIANLFVVLSVAIFLAVDPAVYRQGALALVPQRLTGRVAEYFDKTGTGLFRWVLGQLVAMIAVAVLMAGGLIWIGTPVPIALAIIAGVTNFIPYLGPYIGGAPAVLIAFSVDPVSALWVAGLIFVVQNIEGNFITPNVQKQATSLAPALIIMTVVAFGVLFGLLGIMFATPILFVVVTAVRMFYIEDALGKS
ncbi:AI-2E family transporter [Marivita sp. S0852]|uniref:AI-2E family transporter n=1 Tax=Marivita sp. S0852 TaxID=3373893 RepID=UPI0039823560